MANDRFTAYVNHPTQKVTVHNPPCGQMYKHGKGDKTDNGCHRKGYRSPESAVRLADRLGYEPIYCSTCMKAFALERGT